MKPSVSSSTQAVLDLEDRAPDVLFDAVDGRVPLWPQFRTGVWTALNTPTYGLSRPVLSKPRSRFRAWTHIARSFLAPTLDAPRSAQHAPVCFVANGTTVFAEGNREFNWLVGPFATMSGVDAAIVQWGPLPGRWGKPLHDATWSMEPASVRAQTLQRFSRRDSSDEVTRIVREVLRKLDVELPAGAAESIIEGAVARERERPFQIAAFSRMLDRVQPAVVVMEEASYGTYAAHIQVLRDRGIVVAEPQHGWIGPTHAAYNFGAAMYEGPLRATLPDHLLTFGDYWGTGLRFPGTITTIGKPHLDMAVSKYSLPMAHRRQVLVASSTTDPEAMTDVVLSLRARLTREFDIVFRPHPSERLTLTERYPRLIGVDGVIFDHRGEVYEALGAARALVGVASTVLFEATAFGCQVFALDSPMAEYYVGDRFGPLVDPARLDGMVEEITGSTPARDTTGLDAAMWAPSAGENFCRWLADVQGVVPRG